MLEDLKEKVYLANLDLVAKKMVIYTWGNASEISSDRKYMVIKPSGIDYRIMTPKDMVIVDIATGETIESKWKPSSDTKTHLELYRRYDAIKGIVHTHSINAVAFAQAGVDILGTTHADTFYGAIPCTRELTKEEVIKDYEANTGKIIIEEIEKRGHNPMEIPGSIVKNYGPFTWGENATSAVYNAVVIEMVAQMALKTLQINPNASMVHYILDIHYKRKHRLNAYYGQ